MVPQLKISSMVIRQHTEKVKLFIWREHNPRPPLQIHIRYTGKQPKAASHFGCNPRRNWGWRNFFVARTIPRRKVSSWCGHRLRPLRCHREPEVTVYPLLLPRIQQESRRTWENTWAPAPNQGLARETCVSQAGKKKWQWSIFSPLPLSLFRWLMHIYPLYPYIISTLLSE